MTSALSCRCGSDVEVIAIKRTMRCPFESTRRALAPSQAHLTRACADAASSTELRMNHLATTMLDEGHADHSSSAWRRRKRRRPRHVQKLRGRLFLPPESARQDGRRRTQGASSDCLHESSRRTARWCSVPALRRLARSSANGRVLVSATTRNSAKMPQTISALPAQRDNAIIRGACSDRRATRASTIQHALLRCQGAVTPSRCRSDA